MRTGRNKAEKMSTETAVIATNSNNNTQLQQQ